jgi:hypothetical protein
MHCSKRLSNLSVSYHCTYVCVQARLREIECLLLVIVCVSVLQDCIHVMLTIHCIAHTTARSINRTVVRTMVTLRNEAALASAGTAEEQCKHCLCTMDVTRGISKLQYSLCSINVCSHVAVTSIGYFTL